MWVFNVWLYLAMVFNPEMYQSMKAAGAACYVALPDDAGNLPTDPMPDCWYAVPTGRHGGNRAER